MEKHWSPIEVVYIEQGTRPAWAVMAHGRQAIVVADRDAALRIAEELAEYVDHDFAGSERSAPA